MYARWLVCFEAMAVGVLGYCVYVAGVLRFEGASNGFDDATNMESRVHYINWRSNAREALLVLVLLWLMAVVLSVLARRRAGRADFAARYGSRALIAVAVVLPLASVLVGFVFGLDVGLGI